LPASLGRWGIDTSRCRSYQIGCGFGLTPPLRHCCATSVARPRPSSRRSILKAGLISPAIAAITTITTSRRQDDMPPEVEAAGDGPPRDGDLDKHHEPPLAQGVYIRRYYRKACLQQLHTNTASECHTAAAP
jgi:hypothetical protein